MSYSIDKHIVRDYDESTPVWHAYLQTYTSLGKSTHLSGVYIDPGGNVCAEPDGEAPVHVVLHLIHCYYENNGIDFFDILKNMLTERVIEL